MSFYGPKFSMRTKAVDFLLSFRFSFTVYPLFDETSSLRSGQHFGFQKERNLVHQAAARLNMKRGYSSVRFAFNVVLRCRTGSNDVSESFRLVTAEPLFDSREFL